MIKNKYIDKEVWYVGTYGIRKSRVITAYLGTGELLEDITLYEIDKGDSTTTEVPACYVALTKEELKEKLFGKE